MDRAYDAGYRACPCFWGREPGSLVAQALTKYDFNGKRVLDLGCGEGKNAAAAARAGARVTAIDCSELAITNGRKAFPEFDIEWQIGDVEALRWPSRSYDIVDHVWPSALHPIHRRYPSPDPKSHFRHRVGRTTHRRYLQQQEPRFISSPRLPSHTHLAFRLCC